MTLKLAQQLPPCAFREARPTDRGFIFKSWLERHKTSPTHRAVPSDLYYACQQAVIKAALRESHVIVACNPDIEDQIFGFVVCQGSLAEVCVVHWIHVKQSFRKFGIGSALLQQAILLTDSDPTKTVVLSHISDCYHWLQHKWRVEYNPYLIAMEFEEYDGSKMESGSTGTRRKVRN